MTVCIDKESSYLHGDDMDNDNGNQRGNPARFLIFILTVFLTITAFVIVRPFQASGGAPATVATYSHGLLHLTIAYHAARSGAGQLTIEIPKFKVAVEFSENGKKRKRGYQPGDHVTGTVHANYFFGKPVDHRSEEHTSELQSPCNL